MKIDEAMPRQFDQPTQQNGAETGRDIRDGLSSEQVRDRQRAGEVNRDENRHSKPALEIFLENTFTVFNIINFLIIGGLALLYVVFENRQLALDSLGIVSVVIVNTLISILQEFRARALLNKARLMLTRSVHVIRDGGRQSIPQSEVVRGDVIEIERGDQIVVDGPVLQAEGLEIDESLLTGESLSIAKQPGDELLSGSFVLAGRARFRADKVGSDSYAARVTSMARRYKFDATPLQRNINRIFELSFVIALVVVATEIFLRGTSNLDDIEFIRRVATVVTALVPEGLVLLSTVIFAVGVVRVGKIGALVQKLNAIESFSGIDCVCMDKTGTITENRMTLQRIAAVDNAERAHDLTGLFAHHTPDSNATVEALRALPNGQNAERLDALPFNSARKFSALRLRLENGTLVTLLLGAFDVLSQRLPADQRRELETTFEREQLAGGRSLLLIELSARTDLDELRADKLPADARAVGIISLVDSLRPDVNEAFKLFQREGIALKIMSGDSTDSVNSTLERAGLHDLTERHISGPQLAALSNQESVAAAADTQVFSRLQPEQKLDLIRSLKKRYRTAMIGDGVNDLPAIKEADLGIAMQSGSSITREVSDIVMLNMRFETLPKIFEEGKRVINLVGGISELYLTKNLMILLLGIITLLFATEFPLTPRRAALISVIGVAMPVVFLTRYDKRTRSIRLFFRRLFSFLAASVTAFLAGGYFSLYLADMLPGMDHAQRQMIMLSVLIILALLTYLQLTLAENREQWKPYVFSALGIFGLYLFLVSFEFDFILFRIVTTFYEVEQIPAAHWPAILQASALGALLLFGLHQLRLRWLRRVQRREGIAEPIS